MNQLCTSLLLLVTMFGCSQKFGSFDYANRRVPLGNVQFVQKEQTASPDQSKVVIVLKRRVQELEQEVASLKKRLMQARTVKDAPIAQVPIKKEVPVQVEAPVKQEVVEAKPLPEAIVPKQPEAPKEISTSPASDYSNREIRKLEAELKLLEPAAPETKSALPKDLPMPSLSQ